ncbi:LPD1 domain-containing protein [Marinilabilia rubra]|uniref:Large polyvalent protein-associated domain-containing protein n=1 Tax=Marinilabilia rubra TaxID=2162893 RepID=A0A2U2B6X5_9BACT|nr:LPD1 domain-containing protein [Marinilabilia rubra]PWD98796.1 hypothetical protein DDZ16_13740 [Marinilabilia rubra]
MGKVKYIFLSGTLGQSPDVVEFLREKQKKRKFRDAGEYVPGSAKERAAMRSLVNSKDLDKLEQDEASAIEMVVKDNVWAAYDFSILKASNADPALCYLRNEFRKSFPPKPSVNTPDMRKVYVRTAEYLQQKLNDYDTIKPLVDTLPDVLWSLEAAKAYSTSAQITLELSAMIKHSIEFKDCRDYTEVDLFLKDHYDRLDHYFKTQKRYYFTRLLRENFSTRFSNMVMLKSSKVHETANALYKEPSWDWAFPKNNKGTKSNDKIEINSGLPLSHIRRKGGLFISDNDISEKVLTERYGFNAVQIGHSITDKELKEHIRYFIGAITDLCEALDIDICQIHKIGNLAIAFAARGKGKALAHYEPMRQIINLTRKHGDGTVAHEWGHFFDHLLGINLGLRKGKMATGCYAFREKHIEIDSDQYIQNPKALNLYDKVTNLARFTYRGNNEQTAGKSITRRFYTKDAKYAFRLEYGASPEESLDFLKRRYPGYLKYPSYYSNAKALLSSIPRKFGLEFLDIPLTLNNISEFYAESKFYGSKYWASPVEMFARAFECFVFDRLTARGMENNYLVSGAHFGVGVYPQGEERAFLNRLFESIIREARKVIGLGRFVPFTDQRVDEFIELDKQGDAESGVVFVETEKQKNKKTPKLKNKETSQQKKKETKKQKTPVTMATALELEMEMAFEF